ncbi:hypothetical protein [Bacillus paranthracis]|uniref:Uncharacterized protein n=2 Tax=Bacillus cereus group TaxID=86661 RepID=A0AAX3QKE4_9BACI|nr:hypothetical protein [Bacillus paranthracis]MCR6795662.1 hypothetical protein [Bacillus paranthracis]MED1166033.1 hypothetical protein [Bacillus paranthracis]WES09712.1 hypothetical protein P3K65_27745 [Bacillus paranthracis]
MELTQSQQKKLDDLNMYAKMWLQGKIDGDYFLEICDEIVYPDPADGPYDITASRDRAVELGDSIEVATSEGVTYMSSEDVRKAGRIIADGFAEGIEKCTKSPNKTNEHNERK